MNERLFQLGLHLTPGLGGVLIRHLIANFGTAQKVFEANFKSLIRVQGVGESIARVILNKGGLREAEIELTKLQQAGVQVYFFTDADYPQRFKSLYEAPVVLFGKGNIDLNKGHFVGIVGTRKATDYGKNITEQLIEGLAGKGITVVSGLAYGIDIMAHRACLKYQVPTIGVMATGIDIIYPGTHAKTAQEMQQQGGVLTEYPLGTKPDFMRFPARNRIIAGVTDAIVVVEAADKGGALITAEYANNYNRDVFAVPGNLTNSYSVGCNKLIRTHKAQIYTGVEDFLAALSWQEGKESSKGEIVIPEHFTQEETQVVALLRKKGEMSIDDLTWESQIPPGKLANLLLNLELQGYVRSLPGKRFTLG